MRHFADACYGEADFFGILERLNGICAYRFNFCGLILALVVFTLTQSLKRRGRLKCSYESFD